jgi:hypothetical protein
MLFFNRKTGLCAIAGPCVPQDYHYAISDEFGTVSLVTERPLLRVEGP